MSVIDMDRLGELAAWRIIERLRGLYPRADDVSTELMQLFARRISALKISEEQATAAIEEYRLTRRYFDATTCFKALAECERSERIRTAVASKSPSEQAEHEHAEAVRGDADSLAWWRSIQLDDRTRLLDRFHRSIHGRFIRLSGLDLNTDGSAFTRGILRAFAFKIRAEYAASVKK